ncbi:maltase A3-like [Sitodiplosis mosellana]|uniref:maltase A3-like n=1 Tax=Sitodiplosis mosellana TaxID=263140 RepID=UPI002445317D|nr:maltase A3-like [Sitodiplosis mosellana]XP_055295301.1 maltase A3-like [Sitodiplosis mosellana]
MKRFYDTVIVIIALALLSLPEQCMCSDGLDDLEFVPLKSDSKEWWQTASLYQIYPRSFKDSNGDGIGDLNGITEKLEHLKEIGIAATWLSPIFKSPMKDFGYDVADFYDIQPEYGTLDDFDRLIAKAKTLDIKIILDFVPNHSSDENDWFIKSVNKEPGWEDFYIWHPGYPDENDPTNRLPPTNWISVFRKSAWKWSEKRGEFYFHQFLAGQPDLNYRNPKVVDEMKNVLRFWMDRGVSGFRIDAVPHLFEVPANKNGRLPDEPRSGNTNDPDDWNYLKHIFTVDQPETIDMVYQWREVLDEHQRQNGGDARIMLTEAYSSLNIISQYFGNATHNGSHVPFNFQLLTRVWNESNAVDYISCIDDFMKIVPKNQVANWVVGNHDNHRVGTRLGRDRIDAINMIILTLPGISITYNGEEIGMTDQWLSWKDTVDPAACNSNPSIYEQFTRDPERTPFQWDDSTNAGFSTAPKTWLPIADNYKEFNVAKEDSDEKSYLKVFKSLKELRKEPTLQDGDTKYAALGQQVVAIARYLDGKKLYITVCNIGPFIEKVNLNAIGVTVPETLAFHIVGVSSSHKINEQVLSKNVVLQPREAFVLRSENAVTQSKSYNYFHHSIFDL